MNSSTTQARPAFTSVTNYSHPSGLVSLWYATEWQILVTEGSPLQVILIPDPQDEFTRVVIEVIDVEKPLAPSERKIVHEGIKNGLSRLPEGKVDVLKELEEENQWGLEWQCTFLNENTRVQRRVRLFYYNHYQYSITIQGSSVERYSYWQGMMEFTMFSVSTAPFKLNPQQAP